MNPLNTPRAHEAPPPLAVVGNRLCTDLADVTSDLTALDSRGFWAVVLPFDAPPSCARFNSVREAKPWPGAPWLGPAKHSWTTTLDRDQFVTGVETIRSEIADGSVYQVNLTRRLSAPLGPLAKTGTSHTPDTATNDVAALGAALAEGNPAPFSAVVRIPEAGLAVASASPERFLARDGSRVWSSPIKGTAETIDGFLPKDRAENVMIVDLVRNDLGRVCEWGSVHVPALLATEPHPGLHHLVSTVEGTLRPGIGWAEMIEATFPPGSVTGAPKLAAIESIRRLEPSERGIYCGAIGWVDADAHKGDLNVAIRTFWISEGRLHFGTGGGITYGSDPLGEWAETELKAANLLSVASSTP